MPDFHLRSSPTSPFGRKVKLAAATLGLLDRIEVIKTDTLDPADDIRLQNPLGKIPALVTPDGTVVYDSRVILEYMDYLAGGGRILPKDPADRFPALTLQALADGIMDAAILRRYEIAMREPAERSARWDDHQRGKVERGLAALEANPPEVDEVDVGTIAVACALGYLDFRFDGSWREGHPRLVAWLDRFTADLPYWTETIPS
ncbi:glutathione S-transferase family protein [Mongoliimonas terrestris]|uniref:glutathione S-transferase family protein n=1 Tax=Mongoliimonas terrestris TaxID=1709001 RepID=UPI000949584F|nr:glutathione S-transferase family protein [Mongoliimonas terrestris]